MTTAALSKAASESLNTIDAMLARIDGRTKLAAEANTEPGGYAGATTHPVKDVDDRTEDADEGARSAENTSDVKEDQGGQSVDSTTPGTPGGQDSVQMDVGLTSKATGEDSASETDSAKDGKEDSETSHPARTDNDALDGHKYAHHVLSLIKTSQASGTNLLAKIAVESEGELRKQAQAKQATFNNGNAAPAKPGDKKAASSCTKCSSSPCTCQEAGAKLAGVQFQDAQDAQDTLIVQSLAETIQIAEKMAQHTAAYLYEFEKASMDDEGNEDDPSGNSQGGESSDEQGQDSADDGGGSSPIGGNAAPDDGGQGGMGGGGDEAALLELLGGGQNMGAEEAAGDMRGGGMPPGGDMGGGMPPEGGMGGGDDLVAAIAQMPPQEQAMLAEALAQAGVSAEGFENKVAQKAAAALKGHKIRPGQWKPKTAQERQQFQQLVNYVQEVMN